MLLNIISSLKNSTYQILEIFLGVSLLVICAQITIPLTPIPITMETVAVLFIGLFYNKVNALLTVTTYIILSAIYISIFTNPGINLLIGPTAGYLTGFLVAVYIMSILKNIVFTNKIIDHIFLCLTGNIIIMTLGYLWLCNFLDMNQAFKLGILPFIIPGIIKSVFLIVLIRVVKPKIYE